MNWLNKLLDKLFDWLPPTTTVDLGPPPGERNPDCPYCRGLGYDASGYTCTCIGEQK